MSYFAQPGPLYDHFRLALPLVVPRARFRCLDAAHAPPAGRARPRAPTTSPARTRSSPPACPARARRALPIPPRSPRAGRGRDRARRRCDRARRRRRSRRRSKPRARGGAHARARRPRARPPDRALRAQAGRARRRRARPPRHVCSTRWPPAVSRRSAPTPGRRWPAASARCAQTPGPRSPSGATALHHRRSQELRAVSPAPATPLRIGVVCFSTFGGSGVVAAEIAASLARRGHAVHVFSDEVPGRLDPREHERRLPPPSAPRPPTRSSNTRPTRWRSPRRSSRSRAANGSTSSTPTTRIPHAVSAHLAREMLPPTAPRRRPGS